MYAEIRLYLADTHASFLHILCAVLLALQEVPPVLSLFQPALFQAPAVQRLDLIRC